MSVIAVVLVVVTVAGLIKTRRDPTAKAHPGFLRAPGKTTGREANSDGD